MAEEIFQGSQFYKIKVDQNLEANSISLNNQPLEFITNTDDSLDTLLNDPNNKTKIPTAETIVNYIKSKKVTNNHEFSANVECQNLTYSESNSSGIYFTATASAGNSIDNTGWIEKKNNGNNPTNWSENSNITKYITEITVPNNKTFNTVYLSGTLNSLLGDAGTITGLGGSVNIENLTANSNVSIGLNNTSTLTLSSSYANATLKIGSLKLSVLEGGVNTNINNTRGNFTIENLGKSEADTSSLRIKKILKNSSINIYDKETSNADVDMRVKKNSDGNYVAEIKKFYQLHLKDNLSLDSLYIGDDETVNIQNFNTGAGTLNIIKSGGSGTLKIDKTTSTLNIDQQNSGTINIVTNSSDNNFIGIVNIGKFLEVNKGTVNIGTSGSRVTVAENGILKTVTPTFIPGTLTVQGSASAGSRCTISSTDTGSGITIIAGGTASISGSTLNVTPGWITGNSTYTLDNITSNNNPTTYYLSSITVGGNYTLGSASAPVTIDGILYAKGLGDLYSSVKKLHLDNTSSITVHGTATSYTGTSTLDLNSDQAIGFHNHTGTIFFNGYTLENNVLTISNATMSLENNGTLNVTNTGTIFFNGYTLENNVLTISNATMSLENNGTLNVTNDQNGNMNITNDGQMTVTNNDTIILDGWTVTSTANMITFS